MIQYLVFLAFPLALYAISLYLRDTITGRVRPNKVSWLMWAIAPLIATFVALSDGVGWAVLPVFMSGFGPLLIFIASFFNKKSYWELKPFDYICGFFSIVALVIWLLAKDPVLAIVFAIIADAFAAVPTLRKAWAHPETENGFVYAISMIYAATSFVAVKYWVFPEYGFAVYLVIIDFSLAFSVYHRKLTNLIYNKRSNN